MMNRDGAPTDHDHDHDSDSRRGATTLLGVRVDHVDLPQALARIAGWVQTGAASQPRVRHVVTVNPEFVMAARRDPAFAAVLRRTDLATADGVGIVLAARLLGQPVGARVTGVDLTLGLAAVQPALRIFLLGAAEGVAAEAAEVLRRRTPGCSIVGTASGSPDAAAFPALAAQMQAAGAQVVLVAFGHPRQDLWIAQHQEALAAHGILVAVGVGGTFDFVSGRVPRAPRWVQRIGFEWLYRLLREPWRWRRQLALPQFALLILIERLRRLLRRRPSTS